jgi:hypothetical protein
MEREIDPIKGPEMDVLVRRVLSSPKSATDLLKRSLAK